jgi:pyruvate dehydrogenase E2 component (dihydrolipoamide acetyltransferase)
MPKWGLAMKTGRVVEWLKQPGASVQQGEPIVQIESEKAVNEVESPATGTLRWLVVREDESAPVSAPLAIITAPGEELSDEQIAALLRDEAEARRQQEEGQIRQRAAPRAATARAGGTMRAPAREGGRVSASPAARRLAQELGVDLASIEGTGPQGMISREDVLRAAPAEEAKTAPVQEEERMIDVDGIATHCLIAGPMNAPHVVFVHGLGGSLTTWALNLAPFAEQFRICALDLVGAGDSAKPATDYSAPALAAFLARFLDALGPDWQRVSLVGHSLGGAVILTFAEQHPERSERLVLVDSAGLGPEIDARVIQLMTAQPDAGHIRAELASFFADPALVQQALVDQIYRQRTQPGAHDALAATAGAAFAGGRQQIDLRPALTSLSSPLLAIWGARDSVIPASHAHEAGRAPRGRVEILDGCGHCPHIERLAAFNQLVTSFLGES